MAMAKGKIMNIAVAYPILHFYSKRKQHFRVAGGGLASTAGRDRR
jgi:hypothetical protein